VSLVDVKVLKRRSGKEVLDEVDEVPLDLGTEYERKHGEKERRKEIVGRSGAFLLFTIDWTFELPLLSTEGDGKTIDTLERHSAFRFSSVSKNHLITIYDEGQKDPGIPR
jgi:hypothetical protein